MTDPEKLIDHAAQRPHVITVGDYVKNCAFQADAIAWTIRTLYDAGVPDVSDILDMAENLNVALNRWLEENN